MRLQKALRQGLQKLTRTLGYPISIVRVLREEYDPATSSMVTVEERSPNTRALVRSPESSELSDTIQIGDVIVTISDPTFHTEPLVGDYVEVENSRYRIKDVRRMLHDGGNIGFRVVASRGKV